MASRAARLCTVASVLTAATLAAGGAQAATEAPVGVPIVGRAYQPSQLTIAAGQTVVWQNRSITHHTVTSTTGLFNSTSISPGASYSLTFSDPGTFNYECTIHPGMRGSVTVLAVPAATLQLRLSGRRTGRGTAAVAHVLAARSGPVLLQARRGGAWRTVARGTLDAQGVATIVLANPAHRTLRVELPAQLGRPLQVSAGKRSPV
jgi:plastocyanin